MRFEFFGKPGCVFCDEAKSVLKAKDLPFEYRNIEFDSHKSRMLSFVPDATHVPQIVLHEGDHTSVVGGLAELTTFLADAFEADVIREHARVGKVEIKFKKLNGDIREMVGTTFPDLMPTEPYVRKTNRPKKYVPRDRVVLWDLAKEGFRTVVMKNVISYKSL